MILPIFLILNALFIAAGYLASSYGCTNTYFWLSFYIVNAPLVIYYIFIPKRFNKLDQFLRRVKDKIRDYSHFIFSTIFAILEAFVFVLFLQKFYIGHFIVPTASMHPYIQIDDRFLVDMVSHRVGRVEREKVYVFESPRVISYQPKNLYEKLMLMISPATLCKRLVGMPGDNLEFIDNSLHINGEENHIGYLPAEFFTSSWTIPKMGDVASLKALMVEHKGNFYEMSDFKERNISLKNIDKGSIIFAIFEIDGNIIPIADKKLIKRALTSKQVKLDEDYYLFLGDNTMYSEDSRYFGVVPKSALRGTLRLRIFPFNRLGRI